MNRSELSREAGNRRAKGFLCALLILVLGAATGWAQSPVAAETTTAEQSVSIELTPNVAKALVIHLDLEPEVLKSVEVPKGLTSVGNIQIFEGGAEKIDFSKSQMRITFKNLKSGERITTFGIYDKVHHKWVLLEDGEGELAKLGFKGDFYAGNPATLLVTLWPKEDPCVCR